MIIPSIALTDKQVKFLRMLATEHQPGSTNNLCTHQPMFEVQTKRYLWLPYSSELEGDSDYEAMFGWGSDGCDYPSPREALEAYFEHHDSEPVIPIQDYKYCGYMKDKNGEEEIVTDYDDYFRLYELENTIECHLRYGYYEAVAYFFIRSEAHRYIEYQGHNLNDPRVYGVGAGYSNYGDYHPFYELLMSLGNTVLDIDKLSGGADNGTL